MEDVDVASLDRWADARLEHHRARYRAIWGPHAPTPCNVTECVPSVAVLEEIARVASSTPKNGPICKDGPNGLGVEYRGVFFWTPLENRRYPFKEVE